MDDKGFETAIADLRTEVTSIAEDKLSKGEFKERMDKVAADVSDLLELREKDRLRDATTAPRCEPNEDLARKLVRLGVKSPHGRRDKEGFTKPLLRQFEEDPYTGQTKDSPIVDSDVRGALAFMDEVFIVDRLMNACGSSKGEWDIRKQMSDDGGRELFMKHFPEIGARYDELTQQLARVQGEKATVTTTTGTAWVPTGFTSDLLEIVRVATPELNLIPQFSQPTKSFDYPLLSGSGTAYDRSEGSAPTQGEFSTAKRTFTAKEPAVLMKFTGIMEEDSIVAMAPITRRESVRALAEGISMGFTNGDSDGSNHIDNDLQGSGRIYHAYDGLRQYALDDATAADRSKVAAASSGDPLSVSLVADARAAMKRYGMNAAELALLVHPVGLAHLLKDTSAVMTVDKLGARATILTGMLGSIFGIGIFPSHALDNRQDSVTANGFNESGGTNTLSVDVLFNRFRWLVGDRRQTTFEQDKNIESNVISMVTSMRLSLNTVEADPTNPVDTPHVVAIIDVD